MKLRIEEETQKNDVKRMNPLEKAISFRLVHCLAFAEKLDETEPSLWKISHAKRKQNRIINLQ